MSIIGLLAALFKLAGFVAKYAADRQLITAGQAEAIAANNGKILDDLAKIQAARVALDDPATGRRDKLRDRFGGK